MEEQKFIEFKENFIEIVKTEFRVCNSFINDVKNAKTVKGLKQVLYNNAEDIFELLGGDFDNEYLEDEIDKLEKLVDELEMELSYFDNVKNTMHDEMKFDIYMKLHSKYTPWEFEELLLNGKL